jgi:hypothetical protein
MAGHATTVQVSAGGNARGQVLGAWAGVASAAFLFGMAGWQDQQAR